MRREFIYFLGFKWQGRFMSIKEREDCYQPPSLLLSGIRFFRIEQMIQLCNLKMLHILLPLQNQR